MKTLPRSLWHASQRVPFFNEAAVMIAALVGIQFLPGGAPRLVYPVGVIGAAPIVLAALGVILVFRANRFINFSQLALAAWAGELFDGLARGRPLLRGLHSVCGCVSRQPGTTAVDINFVLSAILTIAACAAIYTGLYIVVIRRFAKSGQLILSLATLYLAQVVTGSANKIDSLLAPQKEQQLGLIPQQLQPPAQVTVTVMGAPIHLNGILLVGCAVAACVGLWTYLRSSRTGAAVTAAAENPARAQTLGVNVVAVTAKVWAVAGLFAGIAGVLSAFGGSSAPQQQATALSIPVELTVFMLVAVVAARFESIWIVGVAGMVLGIVQAAVQLSYGSLTPLDAALVFVVSVLLLLQRDRSAKRGDRDDFSAVELIRELRPVPRELARLETVVRWRRLGLIVGTAALLGVPWVLSVSQASLLADSVIFTLVGLSVLVISGWAGNAALGQFGFGAIGAWAAASSGLPFPFALVLGGLAGAAAAVLVGLPGLRLRGLSLAVSSMAFSVSAYALFIDPRYFGSLNPSTLSSPSVFGLDVSSPNSYYYSCLVLLAAGCGAVVGLRRTRTGRVLIALRSNEPAAQSFGISPVRVRLTGFAFSGFLAAIAGALLAFQLGSVSPAAFTADRSIQIFVFAVIGGLGGLPGPLIGFVLYWLLGLLSTDPLVQYMGTGLGALLLLYSLPGGIAQGLYTARDALLRRIAYRLRITVPSLMSDGGAAMVGSRAPLDDARPITRRAGEGPPMRYKPQRQWALDRLGSPDGTEERLGV